MSEPDEVQGPAAAPGEPGAHRIDKSQLTRREVRALQSSRRHPVLRGIAIVLSVVLMVAVGAGIAALLKLNHNLSSLDVTSSLLRPKAQTSTDPTSGQGPMNILVMGVDSRDGANSAYGDPLKDVGQRSDTTMLVHLAADRRSAVVVSIPRDAMMPAPPRLGADGSSTATPSSPSAGYSSAAPTTTRSPLSTSAAPSSAGVTTPPGCEIDAPADRWEPHMFNENIEKGGVDCVIATVMHNTGLEIDHVMTVDFTGFKKLVDAMGTVRLCTTSPVKDKDSGLDLAAGWHELDGEQSLAFVRTRHGVGDGSDLGRLRLQQDFAAAVVRKATSTGVLLNPSKLYGVLDAATKALRPDEGLDSLPELTDLAGQLREMKPANVRFITAPTEPYSEDANRVQLSAEAGKLWQILREDAPWPGTPEAQAKASASASATPVPAVAPSTVEVTVQNASATDGLATQVARALEVQGFQVAGTTSATAPTDGVVVHHAPAQLAQARELAQALPGARLEADGRPGAPLLLVVGRGAKPVVAVPNREGTTPLPAQRVTAAPVPPRASSSASATPTPALTAKAASDDVCSDTSKQ